MGTVYTQLSLQERRRIEDWWLAKIPVADMARVLKRHKSTIFREIKRNFWADDSLPKKYAGYFGMAAHQRTQRRRSTQRKLIRHPDLCRRVIERIKQGWTPEQIGNRMIHEGAKLRVCQETIYRYIYSKEGMAQELWWYLPEHRKSRRPRRARKRLPPKFNRNVSILFRPDDVAHRRQFGHWKGDLMLFKQKLGQSNVTSLVERVSWLHLQAEIGTQTWFCDPSSPWQKGTVENTNRRARRWLPRKRDITALTDHDMKMISDRLNNTPRKCLGWKTPAEVFREKMMEEMGQSPYPHME